MPARLIIVGGGGHALVVLGIARERGLAVVGVIDDNPECVCVAKGQVAHLGPLAGVEAVLAPRPDAAVIVGLGDCQLRRRAIAACPPERICAPVVALGSFVAEREGATIGAGALVARGAIVQPHAFIDDHAIINTGAIVEHECRVGRNTHIAPGAILAGNVRVGDHTLIGVGARVLPGVSIGSHCVVGAGAVVTRDVPDAARVVGVPARSMA
ncbi:MAG: NeuD/PglB/VioB family sugar acetyltransferase [Planctomycetota bacterium]|nr:NeuD/PglB/VioB family sugar acetyltransferase [Planctomycetota bacterium]